MKYKHIPKWAIAGLIGTIIGYTFLMISPGNYIRAKQLYHPIKITISTIVSNFINITYYAILNLFYIISFLIISVLLKSKLYITKKIEIKTN